MSTVDLFASTGLPLRPADLHATVLKSMGLDHSHLANQEARLIGALLK